MTQPTIVAHADWSTTGDKRWLAVATLVNGKYVVDAPHKAGSVSAYSDTLLQRAGQHGKVLSGFDFPIGMPTAYCRLAGITSFRQALPEFSGTGWADFFEVAGAANEISLRRPFYPRSPGGRKQLQLFAGVGVTCIDDLRRECDRATANRVAACSIFWTLGGNQVGRAAISGWRDLLIPDLARYGSQMALWPFDGQIGDLLSTRRLIVAETYPKDIYARLRFSRSRWSKQRQSDRQKRGQELISTIKRSMPTLVLREAAIDAIRDGFGADAAGEDRFDAFVGLLGMLDVVITGRDACPPLSDIHRNLEGWIFGQT